MKSILITGGSGSFGHAFTKRLLDAELAERICIYSRGEHRQAEMGQALGNDPRLRFFIGDVRDRWRLSRAMENVEVVVHAAALKRIEVGYYNPVEMVKTNVEGAMNVVEAARDAQVQKVVALSTDKAFEPVSPYGQSKALAEQIFLAANGPHGPAFSIVRYGNIWESNGSVIPIWKSILASGHQVVPVTDPNCTRFFMLMREAVALVSRTVRDMEGGEINIPDLPAYRLGDLAEAMGAQMQIVGLPKWEKRHESMDENKSSDKARRMTVEELRAEL